MDIIEFVNNYDNYLKELSLVIRPEYQSIISEMKEIGIHSFISPDSIILNEFNARGLIYSIFLHKTKVSK